MENKKAIITLVVALIFVASALIFLTLFNNPSIGQSIQGNSILNPTMISNNPEKIQKINMTVKNSNYYPDKIYLKKNQPVEITLDNNARGCFRYIVIDELNIILHSQNPEKKITFTPSKRGVFEFHCNSGLGDGKIIVS